MSSLASLIGQIIALSGAVGNVTRLISRSMLTNVQSAPSWQHSILLTTETLRDLQFQEQNILALKPVPMKTDFTFQTVVYSDASGVGAGEYIVEINEAISHGAWNDNQKLKSSTWRELIVLNSVIPLLAGSGKSELYMK